MNLGKQPSVADAQRQSRADGPPGAARKLRLRAPRENAIAGRAVQGFLTGISLLIVIAMLIVVFAADTHRHFLDLQLTHKEWRLLHDLQVAVVDAENSLDEFRETNDLTHLQTYNLSIDQIQTVISDAHSLLHHWQVKDVDTPELQALTDQRLQLFSRDFEGLRRHATNAATEWNNDTFGRQVTQQIRDQISTQMRSISRREQDIDVLMRHDIRSTVISVGLIIISSLAIATALFLTLRREIARLTRTEAELLNSSNRATQMAEFANALQAVKSSDEFYEIVADFAADIFCKMGGTLYLYNNSRDHLQSVLSWPAAYTGSTPDTFDSDECWGLKRGRLHLTSPGKKALNCAHARTEGEHATLCLPVAAAGVVSGLLHVRASADDPILASEDLHTLLQAFCDHLSLALINVELKERLTKQATRDPLTGLFNRRYLLEELHRETARADREQACVSALMIDCDHFKRFNDRFGHAAGDQVLKQVASYLMATLRKIDVVCRYGGEEILVLLPKTDATAAARIAEKLRLGIRSMPLRSGSTELPNVTVSIGVATYPQMSKQIDELITLADFALYEAKRLGRDRVIVAEIPPAEVAAA